MKKVLLSYCKRRIRLFGALAVLATVFAVVFALQNIPIALVLYAYLLCFAIVVCGLIYDFFRYYNRHKVLEELQSGIIYGVDKLPPPHDLLEADYQTLICTLFDHQIKIQSESDRIHTELLEYDTLWAHQIKTPISAMHLLLQEKVPRKEQLAGELFKIEQYVEMVLQYLKLSDMSTDLMLGTYLLCNIVRQAVRKYSRLFILKNLPIDFRKMEDTVLTDEKWLLIVIEQVLSNALKYTNEGKISIYMDPNQEKTLIIEDTGIGIREEDLPRVFDRGFTGFNGRMDKTSTGIGLYLCKKITDKLHHEISINSEVGKGTKVSLNLKSANKVIE